MEEPTSDPTRVTESEVAERLAAVRPGHPRVLITPDQVASFRQAVSTNAALAAVTDELVRRARLVLDAPVLSRTVEGRRLLAVSREALRRQLLLGLAWLRTGEPAFVRQAERELAAVCAFRDWNPDHFLDVAEMSLAVAVGLDWMDDALPPGTRRLAREALVSKGLRPSYAGHDGWVLAHNNWGQVCHGGLVAAALAVLDDEPELARRTIHRAVVSVPAAMAAYAPDGVYPEGPTYWDYGTSFNTVLIDCLVGALGTDFGLAAQPGFVASADFMLHATGPTGLRFNYADGAPGVRRCPTLLWFAARHGWRPPAGSPEEAILLGDASALPRNDRLDALLPFRWPAHPTPHAPLPLDWHGDGVVPVAMHRSGWDPGAWYVGIKAGSPSASHGHMDGGSFVLDALGERWAHDLGAENYHRIESRGMRLWDRQQDGDRWRIFRNGTFSHNTLTIDGLQQRAAGRASVAAFEPDPANPRTRLDLTSLYAGSARRVERTFSLPARRELVVSDALDGLRPGAVVQWSLLTQAEATSRPDGAVLCQQGKRLALRVNGLSGVRVEVVPVESLLADFDSPVSGYRLVRFEAAAPADGRLAWTVTFAQDEG